MKLWKVLGLAGLAGVTATGVILARDRRERVQLEPDDVRARLHERLAQVTSSPDEPGANDRLADPSGHPSRHRVRGRWLRRLRLLAAPGPRSSGRHASP